MTISTLRPRFSTRLAILVGAALAFAPARPTAADTVVFSTDFESGLPTEFSAPGASLQSVQGWTGLGTGSRVFEGSFLRHSDLSFKEVELTLSGLPPHESISIDVLVALIDSWDFEFFQVLVDGELVFSEWFDLASSHGSSYAPPSGVMLSQGTDLGYTPGFYYDDDRAYDLSMDGRLTDIPHSAETVTIVWRVDDEASGLWQGGADESWAIEEIAVTVGSEPSPVESESWGRTKAKYRD